jgi:CspA family cold shock protein
MKSRDGVRRKEARLFLNPPSLNRAPGRDSPHFQILMSQRPLAPSEHFVRSEPDAKEPVMAIGTVKFFNINKGFGFVSPDGGDKDVFVHATAVEAAGMRSLQEGQRVSFDIQPDARGSKASNLKSA